MHLYVMLQDLMIYNQTFKFRTGYCLIILFLLYLFYRQIHLLVLIYKQYMFLFLQEWSLGLSNRIT